MSTDAPLDALGIPLIRANTVPLDAFTRLPVRHNHRDMFGDVLSIDVRGDMLTVRFYDPKTYQLTRRITRPREWFWIVDLDARTTQGDA